MGNASSARKRVKVDDQFTRTQGLYPDRERDVDAKKLRRLILDGKLAPCYPGREEAHTDLEECPICFLHYPSLNRSRCCGKGICTECFLQMKSPVASRPTQCPFCKTPGYAVEHGGPKDAAQKALEKAEEQRVIEAKIRMQREEQAKAAERAHKREKDISEGRVPDPPSPTLFPGSPQRFPAFPPPGPTQSPQSLNTPQQSRAQSGHGSTERSGSGGGRRRSSLNRRVSAIEPDNLWFRAGSSQGSASNSRRTSERGPESDPSATTAADFLQQLLESAAEGRANLAATPGDARESHADPEEGGEGPTPILRALARRGPSDMDMDLDDVMLNEAIWLSLQEEEDRQRQSSRGPSETATAPEAAPDQAPAAVSGPGAQSPGYQDPDEAAASELAKAIAASLEESAAWEARSGGGAASLADGSTVVQVPAPSLGQGSGIVQTRLEGSGESSGSQGAVVEGRVMNKVLGGEALRGDVNEGSSSAGLDAATGIPLGLSRDGLGVKSEWDKRWVQSSVTGFTFDDEPMLGSMSARGGTGLDHAVGDAPQGSHAATQFGPSRHEAGEREGPVRRRKAGSTSESGAAGSSTGPFDLRWTGAPSSGVTSADVIGEGSVTGDLTPPGSAVQDAESHERMPMLGQLCADSVYRSLGDREAEVETRQGGLVSATIGPVEPLSLTELVARKQKAGPVLNEGSPAGLGQVGEGSVSPAKTVARKSEPALSEYNPSDAPWEQPWFSYEERMEHRSLDESRPRRVGLKAERVGLRDGLSDNGFMARTEDRPQEMQGSNSVAAGVKGTGQKWEPFSLRNAPWNGLEAGGGFASTNPFAGTGDVGLGKGLGPSDGPSLERGSSAEAGSICLAPDPIISSGLSHASTGRNQAVEREKGAALGTQSRRSRSLSGAASSAPGEASLSPGFSPVKYPPPRNANPQPGKSEGKGGHRRSVSLKETPAHRDEHSAMRPEAKDTRSVATHSANHHMGSDATFEEQLAAAIALSLAQTDVDDERRKQHEAFEREAFAVAVQTGSNRAF